MKRFGLCVAIVLLSAINTACAGGLDTFASGTWRYKMTVTVETPEGIKTGSAVREVHVQHGIDMGGTAPSRSVKGEAVVVDLGQRGLLFALMDADGSVDTFYQSFPPPNGLALTPESTKYYSSLKNARAVLPQNRYPMFVHFRDINNPKTVEGALDGAQCPDTNIPECLGKTWAIPLKTLHRKFGQDVKIKEVTIETTDESVTWQIDRILPWFKNRRERHVRGALGGSPDKPFEDPTGLFLTGIEFQQGGE